MTPSPSWSHQRLVPRLWALLNDKAPNDLEILVAPFDVRLGGDTDVQPDVLVARRIDLTQSHLPVAPVLVVEVLSPSTRAIDLHSKKDRYRRAGVPSYWVIDPDTGHFTAWQLNAQDEYLVATDIDADDSWHAIHPFEVTVTPRALLA